MSKRLPVLKTYKLFINGAFPRTESGRTYTFQDGRGKPIANICRASRKDVRNAVAAARSAQPKWAARSGYNRGQIAYRLGELVEGRRDQFVAELREEGYTPARARREVDDTIDRLIYYAGWSDKYQQVFSTVNPVASSHFVFSVPEPTGVVAVIFPPGGSLLSLVSLVCPVILGGNTAVVLADADHPLTPITFAEVMASGDVPAGVVNVLTGYRSELLEHIAGHMDINALVCAGATDEERTLVQQKGSLNLKRLHFPQADVSSEDPYRILQTQEIKTTWHPIGL